MNDDNLLFSVDDLELWKKRVLPSDWLRQRMTILVERQRAQAASFERLMKPAGAATRQRLNEPL